MDDRPTVLSGQWTAGRLRRHDSLSDEVRHDLVPPPVDAPSPSASGSTLAG